MNDSEKIRLIREIADHAYDHTESFTGALGRDLAYLYPAIAKGGYIEVSRRSRLRQLLRAGFERDHPIWKYIQEVAE